jgi:hypothetical protein
MYWWNMSKLADDLREGKVNEQRLKYYLATFLSWSVSVLLFLYCSHPFEIVHLIPVCLNMVVTIIGIVSCYKINKDGDGKDFIGRMVCLGWPGAVRTLALFAALFLILIIAFIPIQSTREVTLSEAIGRILRWSLWIIIWSYFSMIAGYLSCAQSHWTEEALEQNQIALLFFEKFAVVLFGGSMVGAIAWAVIAKIFFPNPISFLLGMMLIAALISALFWWFRRQREMH